MQNTLKGHSQILCGGRLIFIGLYFCIELNKNFTLMHKKEKKRKNKQKMERHLHHNVIVTKLNLYKKSNKKRQHKE